MFILSATYKVLSSDSDLLAAALAQVRVYVVWIEEDGPDSIVDYGGAIQKYTPELVKIADTYYTRLAHEFRTHILMSKQ
ncbi:hypothetical protein MHI27_12080 [Paenibacillus sp. FSL H8-0261]|uniref:hypothetical protein n=1 Tax=Paenibacillus sp. FSL H8-0261 TaxID=2921381 RepID=UPI003248E611